MTALIVPMTICLVCSHGLYRHVDVFNSLITGATDGLRVTAKILPTLVALLTAIYMLRASGALDALAHVCAPVFSFLGIPPETSALMFIRPISGSGALAVASEIITKYGADSLIGRTAAIMIGSTETTFYTIAVYFGSAKIKRTRHAIPAALCADLFSLITASLMARLFFS